jgi:hypothetical protein
LAWRLEIRVFKSVKREEAVSWLITRGIILASQVEL